MKSLSEVLFQLSELKELLNLGNFDERQRRTIYGFVARKLGYGGVAAVAKALDVSPITVRKALSEILAATDPNSNTISTPAQTGRIRRTLPKKGRLKFSILGIVGLSIIQIGAPNHAAPQSVA